MPEIKLKRFSRGIIENHLEQVNNKSATVEEQPQPIQEPVSEPNNMNEPFIEMKDLFEDLNNENFVFENEAKQTKAEKENIKLEREKLKLDVARQKEEERKLKEMNKINSKKPASKQSVNHSSNDDELFSSTPTELLGLDKRQLLAKLNQYRALFPKQLKTFKIKKNPTIEDLQNAIAECDAIVATESVEGFMTDSILQCLIMIEGVSARTKYNVSGMSEMLRENPQFNQLCKQLYIKHKVFSNIPPEYQMIMLVATTAMIAKSKNDKKKELESILNKPINPGFLI